MRGAHDYTDAGISGSRHDGAQHALIDQIDRDLQHAVLAAADRRERRIFVVNRCAEEANDAAPARIDQRARDHARLDCAAGRVMNLHDVDHVAMQRAP
jgi:hypothetical protein